MEKSVKSLLLHSCCGPCATGSIERLLRDGYEVTLYFGNSNIWPLKEWEKRFEALATVAKTYNLKLLRGEYNHQKWLQKVEHLAQEPEGGARCQLCFEWNLSEAFHVAHSLGLQYFTTTLTISPHKNSSLIFSVAQQFDNFLAVNFKKEGGFQRSLELSRAFELYRQNYCGCEFSFEAAKLRQ